MGSKEKLLEKVLLGRSDTNVSFSELRNLLLALGFIERTRGSHHIFTMTGVPERINIQSDSSHAIKLGKSAISSRNTTSGFTMTESRYEHIIYWDDIDKIFVVEVPELSGCSAHGASKLDALKNAEDAAKLWLDTAREDGIPIPEPKGRLAFA